ncbi:MAG: GNAT family N-acetyltransferase [Acidobacteria bacterium]|nr:GNAT family N-acetyltransferase [Acidobacteriota bacterium]
MNKAVTETHPGGSRAIQVRPCKTVEDFEQIVDLQIKVWGYSERDAVPSQMFVVAAKTGGQVLGAFVEDLDSPPQNTEPSPHPQKLAGFALAYPGLRDRVPYLHSHMVAVLEPYRDWGVGRALKLAQREDALQRGIGVIEWTFDPLQTKNAYFNICRLGATMRRYIRNIYGSTSSPLHGGLPTDRLVAEWHVSSERVTRILAGDPPPLQAQTEAVALVTPGPPRPIADIQMEVRQRFETLFAANYAVTWFRREPEHVSYILEPQ